MKESLTLQRLKESYSDNVSKDCMNDIKSFTDFLSKLEPCKETHYQNLDETFDSVYEKLDILLTKYGFVNGDPEANDLIPEIKLLWTIYKEIDCSQYSKFYNDVIENCARHHISAYARIYCLHKELTLFLNKIGINMGLNNEQFEMLETLSEKQRVSCIVQTSANIATLQGAIRMLNAYQSGRLDVGLSSNIGEIRHDLDNKVYLLQEELSALISFKK